MELKRIVSIKEYKSFVDFKWSGFCKRKDGQEIILNPFNLFFGENGAGKSSVCDILKDLSQQTNFQDSFPLLAEIEVKTDDNVKSIKKFENGAWNSILDINSILFFDKDFVDRNVHTNGDRSNERNKHSQNSGQLIIQLDETANDFNSKIKIKKQEAETFQGNNSKKLGQVFTDTETNLYNTYEKITEEEKEKLIEKQKQDLEKGTAENKRLEILKIQSSKISSIISPSEISLTKLLSGIKKYEELFTRKIEEETQKQTSEQIKNHITKHRSFVEKGLEIFNQNTEKDKCPFCLQSLENSQDTIKAYSDFFNEEYKKQKQKFIDDIATLKTELDEIKDEIKKLPLQISSLYDTLEKYSTDFSIPNLYDQKKKEEIKKSFEELKKIPHEFSLLQKQLEDLKNIDSSTTDFQSNYNIISAFVFSATSKLKIFNQLIKNASISISDFKKKYSDPLVIQKEMETEKLKVETATAIIDFFQKDIFLKIKEWKELQVKYKELLEAHEKLKKDRDDYLAIIAPEIVLKKMTSVLERFNLSFVLKENRITRQTTEFPFSFRVFDNKGKERNIKTGLSEGERQLISLAFFFAINEKVTDKKKKVLVFDDPITSLDSANLKILSDLIFEQVQQEIYSQVFVFTHHPLFHKYLAKKIKPNPNKFGVLKNNQEFGGSFVYFDPGFDTTELLRNCNQQIILKAHQQTLNVEEIALQYGHLLRLTVERFIKNELLLWNTEKEFEDIVNELGSGQTKIKKLIPADIEVLKMVYKYCNHSNLHHADKETSSALNELLVHIDKFVKLIDKVNAQQIIPVSVNQN